MEAFSPLFLIHLGAFQIPITSSVIVQWAIIIILAILAKFFTSSMKKIPDKKQSVIEIIVEAVRNLVTENMGKEYVSFIPYVGTLAIYILVMNIAPVMIGVRAPTEDLSVAVGLALITFVLVQFNSIKKNGLVRYFGAYTKPVVPLLPINIIERLVLPVSLSLRLFGNLTAGAVIIGMVYKGLGSMAWFSQLLIPIPLHAFFDLFDGSIQMIVFVMLTIMNIKVIAED
ncbi:MULTISPECIES: F0F1 ATP synthase subunit A [Clostridium]|uniref:ATP synthase subunit a n=5 Tax=Clostridium TaxID=1485 RepID=A0A162LCH3_9CLOT|nr:MULTISPECIES: F0F1 ATP synthase subunit A [Clostridium]AGY76554.1 F0F1 ATP synthase subunit A [Clostridium autoethanogenum DSM 10061]ALU36713.1 ATP synthase subunit a [Clostridium autoethanogenum DSM 10061]OAA88946.1 ATP synthase subunit a [Clostridium ljungdahlii DSM 13528]OAA91746.1 ATP synthase subunit a [Clostridium coskatii]OBR91819.1 ATP synthase subunit a [Clostridium ragsdalei P11]